MKDYLNKIIHEEADTIAVCFMIENKRVLEIGEKMNQINELAYMNGYNWEVFLMYYLQNNYPQILDGLENDPEAGTYVAYYENTPENDKKADKLIEIITDLIENESKLYEIVEKEGDKIEWE